MLYLMKWKIRNFFYFVCARFDLIFFKLLTCIIIKATAVTLIS